MSRFLLHPVAFAILITLLIWFGIIVYWQQTVRPVTGADIGIYLVALPAAVIAAGFGLRALYRRSGQARPAAPDAAPAAASASTTDERAFTVALLAVGIASAAGDSAAATYDGLKAGTLRPRPDSELRSRDGFPVHATRVEPLDATATEAALGASGQPPRAPGAIRALALMAQALAPVAEAAAMAAPEPDRRDTAAAATPPKLMVDLVLPAAWPEHERAQAAMYVTNMIGEAGWPTAAMRVNVLATTDGTLALSRLDAFSVAANRAGIADFYLLAACDSAIDEDLVASLEASGALFGSANGQGLIPGEAAVAVLARIPHGMAKDATPMAMVGRMALTVRNKSADAAGRIGHETLLETARQGMAAAQMQPGDIAIVVSDADHRASRCGECMSAINELLPDLNPAADLVGAGQALGRLGSAGALLALGVAAAAVEAEAAPAMVMAVSHATERAVAVLRPYQPPVAASIPSA